MTHSDLTYKALLGQSFLLTKKYFPFLLGVFIIGIIVEGIASKLPFINQVLSLLFSMLTTHVALLVVNGKKPKLDDLLYPFKNYRFTLHYFLAVLVLFALFLLGVLVPLIALGVDKYVFAVAMVMYVLTVIYVGVRFSFFRYFILEDENLGPISALKKSWKVTAGRFWKLVGYSVVLILLNVLGLLALGIGLVFTLPMSAIAITLIYKKWAHPEHHTESHHVA